MIIREMEGRTQGRMVTVIIAVIGMAIQTGAIRTGRVMTVNVTGAFHTESMKIGTGGKFMQIPSGMV
ncbi:hypothetical protein ACBO_22570 [Acinetobacter bouvetii]|nr:hypothetical protein ACBO_22570 [Acinetobacter bouvetii]